MIAPSLAGHEWWLASRAAGIVALVLVAVSVGLGLANAARLIPPRRRRNVVAVHEQVALASLISIAAHGLLLLPDHWLHPGLAGIAIPMAGAYRPLPTAFGIVGGYLAALLGLSFYVRRHIGARLWRRMHTATPIVYVLALAHALTAGTDAGTRWFGALLLLTALPSGALLIWRVLVPPAVRREPARRPRPSAGTAARPARESAR